MESYHSQCKTLLSFYPGRESPSISPMLPRKLSFPQLPPPPPYAHKRSFHQPTTEELHALRLVCPPPNVAPPPTPGRLIKRGPPRRSQPSPPHPRTPSPSRSPPEVVISDEADERPPRQPRPRADSRNQLTVSESQGRPTSISASSSSSSSAPSPRHRSPGRVRPAPLPPPPHPPPSRPPPSPPPSPPSHPPPRRPTTFDILPSEPIPFSPPAEQIPQQHRSRFRFKLSRPTRPGTAPTTVVVGQHPTEETRQHIAEENARRAAYEREVEELARRTSEQDIAKEYVETVIENLLQGKLPSDEERTSTLAECAQACEKEGLDLSTVLQDMLIEGYSPIYWAIVNRPVASEDSGISPDSLVLGLLNVCRPLSPATLANIRVACMVASDNALLHRLFKSIPPLSHISTRDALLLGPANEEDRVDVEEMRNGTGSWVAHIKIPRFRLRMRVCQTVSVEFIASGMGTSGVTSRVPAFLTPSLLGRIWNLAFSAVVETSPNGRSESRWYLSLELGDHSPPTPVNANLVILGSSDATEEDSDGTRSIHLGHPTSNLYPGRDKALKIRLDDGPIGPHLLNECVGIRVLALAAID